jgi:hypothetical protein
MLLSLATRLPSPSAAAIGFVIGLLALLKIRRSAGALRGKLMACLGLLVGNAHLWVALYAFFGSLQHEPEKAFTSFS